MRISFLQGFNRGVDNILRVQEQTYKTQEQISTGRRVVTPADDPVASARIVQVNQELSQLNQYIDNADAVENRLSLAENQVQQVSNLLVRVRELAIQAGGPAAGQADRQNIAAELDSRLDELLELANTRDVNGEYIFAGFQGAVQPFAQTQTGEFVYRGDEGQRMVPVGSSTDIPISDSGKAVFMDIESARNRIEADAADANTGAAQIVGETVSDQGNYDANAYPQDYVVRYDAGGSQFQVFTRDDIFDGAPNTSLLDVPLAGSGVTTIDADTAAPPLGWELDINGTPDDGDVFFVNSSNKQDVLTTVSNLSEGLKSLSDSPADQAQLEQLIADTLTNLTNAEANMSEVKAQIGARQNTLDSVRSVHEGVELVNQEVLSEIRDLDYAEALSRLSMETFTLEAAQRSFTRVNNLSLFNFLG